MHVGTHRMFPQLVPMTRCRTRTAVRASRIKSNKVHSHTVRAAQIISSSASINVASWIGPFMRGLRQRYVERTIGIRHMLIPSHDVFLLRVSYTGKMEEKRYPSSVASLYACVPQGSHYVYVAWTRNRHFCAARVLDPLSINGLFKRPCTGAELQ